MIHMQRRMFLRQVARAVLEVSEELVAMDLLVLITRELQVVWVVREAPVAQHMMVV
jgi:hypothetical protein